MAANIENLEFGKTWFDVSVDRFEGFRNNMSDYHMHEYYEISLILSGDANVLLPDAAHRGTECRMLLTGPMTPHFVICEPQILYRRVNVLFSGQFLAEYIPEWQQMLSVFGKRGRIILLTPAQCAHYLTFADKIEQETSLFRKRLHLLLFLSELGELAEQSGRESGTEALPAYVSEALSYIQEHYAEKLVATELASRLHIGRTTLMTAFKHYTGSTLGDYVAGCRLKHAMELLRTGETAQHVAEQCGFGDSCNLIRCFRRKLGITPMQYVKNASES